jgi:hypothetical protein
MASSYVLDSRRQFRGEDERGLGPGAKGVRVTERGRRVQELAYLIIADFAGQLSAAARSAASSPKE